MFAISVVAAVYDKTDTFLLGLFDKSKAAVGSYAVGIKGVEIVIGVITALSTIFIPRATAYYEAKDARQFRNINIYASNIAMFIVLPAIILMICLSKPLTLLIGGTNGYTNAHMVLIALASLMLTFSICNIIYTQILIPTKREKTYLFILLFGAITNIVCSLLFGLVFFKNNPAFGVALGTAITDSLMLLIMFMLTWEHSRHILLSVNNIKILVVSLLLIASTVLLNKYLDFHAKTAEEAMIIKIAVIFGIDLVIYLVGCFLTKEKLVRSFFKKA
jgi:O-antigen/teichoic acid export membrane protein